MQLNVPVCLLLIYGFHHLISCIFHRNLKLYLKWHSLIFYEFLPILVQCIIWTWDMKIGFSFSCRANVNTAHLAVQSCVNYIDHNIFLIKKNKHINWCKICWRQSKYTILGKLVGKWENQLCICQVNEYVWPHYLSFKMTTVFHKGEYKALAIKKWCTVSCLTITEKSRHGNVTWLTHQ